MTFDRILTDDEESFEENSFDNDGEPLEHLDFDREEGHIYESIEDEVVNYDAVLRELPDFDPTEDLDVELDDSKGG